MNINNFSHQENAKNILFLTVQQKYTSMQTLIQEIYKKYNKYLHML
jgi:hypothetical protein